MNIIITILFLICCFVNTFGFCLFFRWSFAKLLEDVPTHVLRVYRDQLDHLSNDQFIWQPYDLASLPPYCLQGVGVWRTRSPLICFEKVEWHLPDRVHRQFGMLQRVPLPCNTQRDLHRIDRRSRDKRWAHEHRDAILQWDARVQRLTDGVVGEEPVTYTHPYMTWYRRITRLLVGNPSHREDAGYRLHGSFVEGLVS